MWYARRRAAGIAAAPSPATSQYVSSTLPSSWTR
eukprot:CAMPEP_0203817654 /NCGR_PEP_ID=MMETSP0115-20131106/27403_1 /ASSEMBLY_ACC=CAM_ASM_000227 /TAXON_ID=33651 /ORGANISM="Bicosoecid sp, Strain ms1" /LENGTH=33 /DNA_ID= /DNA_START= /DNA_END= /DNA_ORIENTATION=